MAKTERNRIVGAAPQENNKWVGRRFVVIIFLTCAVLIARFESNLELPSWFGLVFMLGSGLLLYLYLLWEINETVEAVSKYASKKTQLFIRADAV